MPRPAEAAPALLYKEDDGDLILNGEEFDPETGENAIPLSYLDTDGTMAANSDVKVPSQKAVVTKIAAQLAALVASSPAALDTLDELAAALGDDANFAATVTAALATKIAITSVPYDLSCHFVGAPATSAVGLRFVAVRAFTLLAAGHRAKAGTSATAETDFLVAVNGVTKATLRFAISGTTCTIVGGTETVIAADDVITITAPASADATLADIGFTLAATLL